MLDLTDRSDCFYWQTDRNLSPEDYQRIFLQRHDTPATVLETILKNGLTSLGGINSIKIESPDENVVKGNVNIVRKILINGKPYVVRMHPAGVKNGYFFVEKLVLKLAKKHAIPVPLILEVHESKTTEDMDFVLMTQASGITMDVLLAKDKSLEKQLLYECGKPMAKIHEIKVEGFGPFNNQQAKNGKLIGLHRSYHDFIHAGLDENIQRLRRYKIINIEQANNFKKIFAEKNFEPPNDSRLIQNDFADWNLLTDGKTLTGVLDWDECHAGDPVADLACWSPFFDLARIENFMRGYTEIAKLPDDYEERFHFYRLRYTISKMALRIKRYQVDKAPDLLERLEIGNRALAEELAWLKIKHY